MAKKSAEWKQHLKDSWTPEKRAAASARQKERMRVKEIRQRQSDAWTPEMREAASDRMSGTTRLEETKKKIRDFWDQEARDKQSKRRKGTVSAFKGKHHTEEAKQKNREAHKGKPTWNKGKKTGPHTLEHNQHISQGIAKYPKGNAQWYMKKDGTNIWLRSSYEVRIATVLDKLDINWQYEPKSFKIDDHRCYRPDFLLNDNIWWEAKGYMYEDSKYKLSKFIELYPEEFIKVMFKEDIEELENMSNFGDIIDFKVIGTDINNI
jgi:hypothetical protein